MSEPEWAAAVRERTEQLIRDLHTALPAQAGPAAIERVMMAQEAGYFADLTQRLIDSVPEEKKDTPTGS